MDIVIEGATPADAAALAAMTGELLNEIMAVAGVKAFKFVLEEATDRARELLERERYFVFLARAGSERREVGFVALCESWALYAEGAFGILPELYVRPAYRSAGVGRSLVEAARDFGRGRGWKRLEVTTPPLPEFERTLRFYEGEGFSISGGRKVRVLL